MFHVFMFHGSHAYDFLRAVHRRLVIVRALERCGACVAVACVFAGVLSGVPADSRARDRDGVGSQVSPEATPQREDNLTASSAGDRQASADLADEAAQAPTPMASNMTPSPPAGDAARVVPRLQPRV